MAKIIVSPGYGAGWSTWDYEAGREGRKLMLTWPPLIAAIEAGEKVDEDHPAFRSLVEALGHKPYSGGLQKAVIKEVPEGVPFTIQAYDGSESLHIVGGEEFLIL